MTTIKQFAPDPKTGIPGWKEVPIERDPVACAQGCKAPDQEAVTPNPAIEGLTTENDRLKAENQELRTQLAKQAS